MKLINLTEQSSSRIKLLLKFDKAQSQRLKCGFTPRDMDDRWMVKFDSGLLRCYRSWSGHEIFCAKVCESADGCEINEVNVLDDKDVYNSQSRAQDEENFKGVIKFILSADKI